MGFKPTAGRMFVFAGPCVIESLEQCLTIARELKAVCQALKIDYCFKASFDKANRSSGGSFRGPGMTDGLVTLEEVQEKLGLPVVSDVHEVEQATYAGKVLDVVPHTATSAFTSRKVSSCRRRK
jgi:2-dehydro-3-deoxyphosphooctonate aldolase (KDO 8-P synthase)